ncbi:hypothetical protein B9Z55_000792 [Caenorhabditis nigoni]|uniref:Uncharacterized protein n=1 Tax=Caenorhabditis nigoni TaxID=1611254 RepID=A0A2G5VUX7_9PELO|nr:hypothetical protein B9Z55_000792 [Caenorhabditis nigoni]
MSSSQALRSAKERALQIVEKASRIRIQDARDNIGARTAGRQLKKGHNQMGHTQGALERAAKPPLGWIWGDFFRPWQRMYPGEKLFNADIKYGFLEFCGKKNAIRRVRNALACCCAPMRK